MHLFSLWFALVLYQKLIDSIYVHLFLDSVQFLIYLYILMLTSQCPSYYSFVVSLEIW